MAANDSWMYQGRQQHMWFGHGTKPGHDTQSSAATQVLPPMPERIHAIGLTLVAGLPPAKRHHAVARLRDAEHDQLDRVLAGVVHALPLGPRLVPFRVLGTHAEAPGVASFVGAGRVLWDASSHTELRDATDLVARSALEMGLDQFKPFLRRADDHLTHTGGLLALVRDLPSLAAPPAAKSPTSAPMRPQLPPPGRLLPLVGLILRRAGWVAMAGMVVGAIGRANYEGSIRDAVERFGLDPSDPADMAAAAAYAWARVNRSLLMGTGLPESAQDAVAEQVMRAVRADPALLDRAMEGDADALAAVRSAVKQTPAPPLELGHAYELRTDEERELAARMMAEGRSGAEIQDALENLRASRKAPTAEERRQTPGVVVMTTSLPRIDGSWLAIGRRTENGASIPAQVAEKLVGKQFATFRAFREAFWQAVVEVPELAQQFNKANRSLMKRGYAICTGTGRGTAVRCLGAAP